MNRRTALALLIGFSLAGAAPDVKPAAHRSAAQASVRLGEQNISYIKSGSGPIPILLLHGWPQSAHEWHRVMPLLDDRFTVIAPDLPGIGGSTAPRRDFTKAAVARDLHAFIAKLGIKRPVVVGHDIGGMVAYAYARQFPAEVRGVAILDVPLPGIAPWDAVKSIPQSWHFLFHAQEPLAEKLVAGRQATYFRYFIDKVAKTPAAISEADVHVYAAAHGSREQLAAGFGYYRAFASDEAFNAARSAPFDAPVLVVGADGSMGQGAAVLAEGLRKKGVRDLTLVAIANSGHWIAEEQPTATAHAISEFAARLK